MVKLWETHGNISFGTSQFNSLNDSPWPLLTGCPGGMLGRGTKPGRAASVGASPTVTQETYLRRTKLD